MSYSYSTSFTLTNARHLAAKVAADLYQCYLLYDHPSAASISDLEAELTTLLAGGYVDTYEFGFKRDGRRVLSWFYRVGPAGTLTQDSGAGQLLPRASIASASYFNFLTKSQKWAALTSGQKAAVQATLPFEREYGDAPTDGHGSWQVERTYTSGGVMLERRVFKPW